MNNCLLCGKETKNPKYCSLVCSNKVVLPPLTKRTKVCKTCKNFCLKRKIYCKNCWETKEDLRKITKPKRIIKDKKKYNAYLKNYMHNRYKQRRAEWIVQLGGKCNKCGGTEYLEIDHIDYNTKTYDVSNLYSYKNEIVQNELRKCQLLCKICHKEKSDLDNKYMRLKCK